MTVLSCFVTLASIGFSAEPKNAPQDPWLIIPGVRWGAITADASEDGLRKTLGPENVAPERVDVGEGETEPGTTIYKNDYSKYAQILWKDSVHRKNPESVRVNGICSNSSPCLWHTKDGIRLGTSLKESEKLNGAPFFLSGFGWDYSGTVMDWNGGKLASGLEPPGGHIWLRLGERQHFRDLKTGKFPDPVSNISDKEYASVVGDKKISSGDPVMQKIDPIVGDMGMTFK